MQNLKAAVRQLFKNPSFSIVVILMLALGIGATTGMYSIYHTILLKPLPVYEPDRLVNLSVPGPKAGMTSSGNAGRNEYVFSYPMLQDLEARQEAFSGIAGHRLFGASLSFEGQTVSSDGVLVSGEYFSVLGLEPALGSLIGPEHQVLGQSPVVVLTHDYWRDAFGSSPDVLNQTLIVNGHALTVIGVAPESFNGTTLTVDPKVFVPLAMYGQMMPTFGMPSDDRRAYWIYAFARLRGDIGIDAATESVNSLYAGIINEIEAPLHADLPEDMLDRFLATRIVLEPGAQGQSNAPRIATTPLTLLLGVSVLVLAIVCVNVAGLLLVRSDGRAGETAVRASIGARRGQLVSLFLSESALLAVLGACASIPVANATIRIVISVLPAQESAHIDFGLDWTAFVFAGTVTVLTLFLFGLVPALRSARVSPSVLINAHGSKATGSRASARFRAALAGSQIALSMLLLVLAGLFVQSLYNVTRVDLGMDVDSLVTFAVSPRLNGYDDTRSAAMFDRIEQDLAAMPGVTHVAASMVPLLTGSNWTRMLTVEGRDSGPGIDTVARLHRVGPGFFETLSMPLLAGRDFQSSDRIGSPDVAIVNEAFLRKFSLEPDDAIGRRFAITDTSAELNIEIVGIVPDAKYSEVKDPAPPQFYLALDQASGYQTMNFYVRGEASADVIMERSRATVAAIDPNLPVQQIVLVRDVVTNNIFLDRLLSTLASAFAIVATLLAAIGVYGTLAYGVRQRTRELGIRLALGATPARIRSDVLGQVFRMAVIGGGLGLTAAVYLAGKAEMLLYETGALSPIALVGAALAIGAVAFTAGFIPARQASRIAPMESLRYE